MPTVVRHSAAATTLCQPGPLTGAAEDGQAATSRPPRGDTRRPTPPHVAKPPKGEEGPAGVPHRATRRLLSSHDVRPLPERRRPCSARGRPAKRIAPRKLHPAELHPVELPLLRLKPASHEQHRGVDAEGQHRSATSDPGSRAPAPSTSWPPTIVPAPSTSAVVANSTPRIRPSRASPRKRLCSREPRRHATKRPRRRLPGRPHSSVSGLLRPRRSGRGEGGGEGAAARVAA